MSRSSIPKQTVTSGSIPNFVRYVSEISFRIKSAPPLEWREFAEKVRRPKFVYDRRHIPNLIMFYRMGEALYRNRSLTMRELSQEMCVPLSTATRIVSLCVDDGIVQRFSDPKDRRKVGVSLTDMGRKLHRAFDNQVSQGIQIILDCLTAEEQKTLLSLLERIVTNLKGNTR